MGIDTILLIIAAICFGVATIGVASPVNLVALGLFLVTLAQLI